MTALTPGLNSIKRKDPLRYRFGDLCLIRWNFGDVCTLPSLNPWDRAHALADVARGYALRSMRSVWTSVPTGQRLLVNVLCRPGWRRSSRVW